jgi:hypothetical protein
MQALIPTRRHRASTLRHDGGTVYLSVHEAEIARQRVVWIHRLRAAHPDHKGGSTDAFRNVRKRQDVWKAEEATWQAHHAPPSATRETRTCQEVAAALDAPVRSVCGVLYRKARRARRGHGGTTRERLLGALLDAQPHTVTDLCATAGIKDGKTLQKALYRLRARGIGIQLLSIRRAMPTYQLVLPTKRVA